jgi:parallel beta-helix repeat protein
MRTIVLIFSVLLPCFGQEKVFQLATNGNDGWSGTQAVPAESDGPFKTLARALKAAREARAAGANDVRIVLRGGRYELPEAISLEAADSGTENHPLTIAAAENEKPVLSGGHLVTGWTRQPQNPRLWKIHIPEVQQGKWQFRQLFVNGERKTRARTPNTGFFRIQGASSQDNPFKLKFKPGDIKKEWAGSGDVEVIGLFAWSDIRMQIRVVDEANHIVTLSGNPRPSNRENDARYWVENAPEFLDSPGEWYLDPKTGILSYWAEENEDLNQAVTIAPVLDDLVLIKGNPEKPVHDITFRGIEFSHTDWTLANDGYADTQAAVATRGDLRAEFTERLSIRHCKFSHLAGYGVELGRGCRRCEVTGSEFVDLGAGGIRIGEPARPRNASEENNSHLISDNLLHQLGRVYPPAVGIFILQSGTNRVAHNDIHDLYYTAISVGWNWGYQETPCRENVIEYNHLYNIGQDMLSDMGAVYTLGIQQGTIVRNNLIHDVSSFGYGGWGLYTDEGSTGILLENNIVYNCKSAGFHQHYGRENVLRNNIFAFNRENQLMRTRPEPHISFIFTNNIVYFDTGNLLGSNWSNDNYVLDHNIYFDTRLGAETARADKMKFAGASFEDWKKRGHDQHSIIADPKFIAPDKRDFRLQSDSPALAQGFRPIDLSVVGPRPILASPQP